MSRTNWKRRYRRKVRRRSLAGGGRPYPAWEVSDMSVFEERYLAVEEIIGLAGYKPGADGRLALPNTQECADAIARATIEALAWHPGDARIDLTITGPAPVWAYLVVGHAVHGLCRTLTYVSPVATIVVFRHDAT